MRSAMPRAQLSRGTVDVTNRIAAVMPVLTLAQAAYTITMLLSGGKNGQEQTHQSCGKHWRRNRQGRSHGAQSCQGRRAGEERAGSAVQGSGFAEKAPAENHQALEKRAVVNSQYLTAM